MPICSCFDCSSATKGLRMSILKDKDLGEGPRSGGGNALSGAGAKRKEGVQPPDHMTGKWRCSQ